MPGHTPAEKQKKRVSRTERELTALGEGSGSRTPRKTPASAAPVKSKTEKISVGRNNSKTNAARLTASLNKRIAIAQKSGNNVLAIKLAARRKALQATIQ